MSAEGIRWLNRRKTPVYLISGVDATAMHSAALSLQLSLGEAVTLRHTLDPASGVLTRIVSDLSGVVEREEIHLQHACASCAIREDVVPTLEQLAASGRWGAIVACLPVTAEAAQVCRVLGWGPNNAPHVQIAAVLVALDGATVAEDLLGEDLFSDRGLAMADDDSRGVAEVACAMVEYADLVCLTQQPCPEESALLAALARPRVAILDDLSLLDAARFGAGLHHHVVTEAWVDEARDEELPPLHEGGVWRLDLRSDRPFHPERFTQELPTLGGGPRRGRGCFWLPTRPRDLCAWDSAGGFASIGRAQEWEAGQRPFTRIVVTGIDHAQDQREEIEAAFARSLVTDEELASLGWAWDDGWDGLETWLGPIDKIA